VLSFARKFLSGEPETAEEFNPINFFNDIWCKNSKFFSSGGFSGTGVKTNRCGSGGNT
jgi:hypothetical protein